MATIGKVMILKSILRVPEVVEVLLNGMREFTWKRSPVKLFKMMNPLHIIVNCKYIKEHIPERGPTNVTSVVKLLHLPVVFKCTKKHIQERNLSNVSSVIKLLHIIVM